MLYARGLNMPENRKLIMFGTLGFHILLKPKRLIFALVLLSIEPALGQSSGCRFLLDNCNQPTPPTERAPKQHSYQSLVACCIAYCRLIECNSPSLPRACSRETLALYSGMSIEQQKQNYLLGVASYFGKAVVIPACM